MVKLIVSIVLTIAAFWFYKKSNTVKEEPENRNGVFLVCLIPVVLQYFIDRGETEFTRDFGPFFFDAMYYIFTAIWMQVLIIGAGIRFFRTKDSKKINFTELFPVLGIFTMVSIIDGFGLNLIFAFGLGLLSCGLFLLTDSLDISISIHLLFNAVRVYSDSFVLAPYTDARTHMLLSLGNSILLIILGVWIMQDHVVTTSSEEGRFNG